MKNIEEKTDFINKHSWIVLAIIVVAVWVVCAMSGNNIELN